MIVRRKITTFWIALTLVLEIAGCGTDTKGGGADGGSGDGPFYAVSSIVTTLDTQTGYVNIMRSLTPSSEEVDLRNAYEFAGAADMWVYDGSVFVSDGDSPTITKFSVTDDGQLAKRATVSFAGHGVKSAAFWYNTFISKTKAYMLNGITHYVIWNPSTMEITGTIDLPKLAPRHPTPGKMLLPRTAYSDRSNVVHGGRLYQPVFWSDDSYADRTPNSQIIVFDIDKDKFLNVLDAPCPGLEVGTLDESENIYFSPWTGGVGTHHVLGTAANCVAKVATDTLDVSVAFHFANVAGGREGAVFHYAGAGRFLFSVFYHERVDIAGATEPFGILEGNDWRLWSYDLQSGNATEMTSVAWNTGAAYWFEVGGSTYGLIPAAKYGSSTVYAIGNGADNAARRFGVLGHVIRLFRVR